MKTLLYISIFFFGVLSTSFGSTTPESIIISDNIEMQACATMDLFHSVTFDNTNNALSLTTTEEITVLQIFNSVGKMLYQLPVLSNQMVISQDFLEKGNYKLGFVLKNNTQVHFTTVSIS